MRKKDFEECLRLIENRMKTGEYKQTMKLEKKLTNCVNVSFLKARRLNWLGSIVRRNDKRMVKIITDWKPLGEEVKRKSRKRRIDCVKIIKTSNWMKDSETEVWQKLMEQLKPTKGCRASIRRRRIMWKLHKHK